MSMGQGRVHFNWDFFGVGAENKSEAAFNKALMTIHIPPSRRALPFQLYFLFDSIYNRFANGSPSLAL